jgi:hypothetical protein
MRGFSGSFQASHNGSLLHHLKLYNRSFGFAAGFPRSLPRFCPLSAISGSSGPDLLRGVAEGFLGAGIRVADEPLFPSFSSLALFDWKSAVPTAGSRFRPERRAHRPPRAVRMLVLVSWGWGLGLDRVEGETGRAPVGRWSLGYGG